MRNYLQFFGILMLVLATRPCFGNNVIPPTLWNCEDKLSLEILASTAADVAVDVFEIGSHLSPGSFMYDLMNDPEMTSAFNQCYPETDGQTRGKYLMYSASLLGKMDGLGLWIFSGGFLKSLAIKLGAVGAFEYSYNILVSAIGATKAKYALLSLLGIATVKTVSNFVEEQNPINQLKERRENMKPVATDTELQSKTVKHSEKLKAAVAGYRENCEGKNNLSNELVQYCRVKHLAIKYGQRAKAYTEQKYNFAP
jgi:hypothetical protein